MEWEGEPQQNPDMMNKGKRKTISVHDGAGTRSSTRSTAGTNSNPRNEEYIMFPSKVRCDAFTSLRVDVLRNIIDAGDLTSILGPDA